jgi:hyperosmotically inducible periplasmic protein
MAKLTQHLKVAACACALIGSSAAFGFQAQDQYPNSQGNSQQTAPNNQYPDSERNSQQAAPDNSARNRGQSQTADQQKENPADRETARKVRQAIAQDKMLSHYAHNVKIIATNGMVTLKGPVRSDEEKQTVVAKAAEVVGRGNVTDELTVKRGEANSGDESR